MAYVDGRDLRTDHGWVPKRVETESRRLKKKKRGQSLLATVLRWTGHWKSIALKTLSPRLAKRKDQLALKIDLSGILWIV
jgi:hypothetical protein